MALTAASASQLTDADGRVDLVDRAALTDSSYANEELLPTKLADRKWTTYNYAALWMGMAHNIPATCWRPGWSRWAWTGCRRS